MSGFRKIATAIVAVFISCFVAFSCLIYFHIQHNIEEEMTGALSQVREMVNRGIAIPDIKAIVEPSPHLAAHYVTGSLQSEQVYHSTGQEFDLLRPVIIPVQRNQFFIVTPSNATELSQNLTFFVLVAGLFFTTFILLLFTLKVAIRQRLVPLNQLGTALLQLREGTVPAPLPHSDITEMDTVLKEFQHLQNSLSSKEQQLIRIDQQLALLQEQERSYLARELHDNVGQLLTTIKAHAYILVNATERSVIEFTAHKVQVMSHQISDAIRTLTAHLHPLVLDRVSLQASLERLLYEQENAQPETQWSVSINLNQYQQNSERDIHLYRFVQEAVNNVIKHASATQVSVVIYGDSHQVSVVIKDNGRGLSNPGVESIGMSSMRSRARCIGANCSVTSPEKGGVTVSLSLALTDLSTMNQADVA